MIYTTPEIEIVLFDAADVIRTSAVSDVRGTDIGTGTDNTYPGKK